MEQVTIQEIKGFFQEIRELYQETDRKFQETREDMREQSREIARRMAETDRQIKATDRQMKETDRRMKETHKRIGELTNRLGEFVEEMVKPGVEKLFQERGIDIHSQIGNMKAFDAEGGIQVDLAVRNSTEMVLVECKSKLSEDDVNDHLERLAKFKKYFPEYSDKQVMGAVAAMVIPEDIARYAYRKGLFVMTQSGDMMTILNDEKFEPTIF